MPSPTDCIYICILYVLYNIKYIIQIYAVSYFIAIIYLYLILVNHKTPVEIGRLEISKYVYMYFLYIDVVVKLDRV